MIKRLIRWAYPDRSPYHQGYLDGYARATDQDWWFALSEDERAKRATEVLMNKKTERLGWDMEQEGLG